jgi:uncharacterized protein
MTEPEFISDILANPTNRTILKGLPELGLPDAWLVSGALFQTAWNILTGRPPAYGIKDYDVFYFDSDESWDAEDAAIGRSNEIFAGTHANVEVRNQARVHLWYSQKFGVPYPPLTRATDGIDRFLMHNAQVGIRPQEDGFEVYAPHGFDDIAAMVVRPNRTANFRADLFSEKASRWKASWPELTILSD